MAEYDVHVPDSLKKQPSKSQLKREAVQEAERAEKTAAEAPKVALDSKKRRVRLRGADHALPCTVMGENREISVTLQPNRWMEVPEEIYQMLKSKFGRTQEREVPDWDSQRIERTPRYESPNAPIIEGL